LTFVRNIFFGLINNFKEFSKTQVTDGEIWLYRVVSLVALIVQIIWINFADVLVPGFSLNSSQYFVAAVCFMVFVHSFLPQLKVQSIELGKLTAGLTILLNSFYSVYVHNLHFSEILGSILTILVVFTLLKTYFSVALFSIVIVCSICPFLGYKDGLVPSELAMTLWACLTSISAATAFSRIFNFYKSRKQFEFTENLITSMSEGVVIHNRDHKITKMNIAANQILEVDSIAALGKTNGDPMWKTYHEDGSPMPPNEHPSFISITTGKKVLNFPIKYASEKTGQSKSLLVSSVPLFEDSETQPSSVLVTLLDVTLHKLREKEFNQQQALLFQAGKLTALGEMAAGIAHEINNPLAILSGKITIMKQMIQRNTKLNVDTLIDHFDKMEQTTLRISKIINMMRKFSRTENRDPFEVKSIRDLIEETFSMCRAVLSSEFVEVRMPLAEDFYIFCNPIQMEQVLMNLLQNARDAVRNEKEKWIEINCNDIGDSIQITCTDSGPRIPDDIAAKIMQPFFTTKEIGKGTGIGLSISKSIITQHKGTLVLNRQHPETQFIIQLPKAQNPNLIHEIDSRKVG
jgi:signal transduction histidine kinase